MPEKVPNSARPDEANHSTTTTTAPDPAKTPTKQADKPAADHGQPASGRGDRSDDAVGPAKQPTSAPPPAPQKGPSTTPVTDKGVPGSATSKAAGKP